MAGQRAFIGIDRATFVGLFIASIGLLAAELGGELIGEWLGVSRPLLLSLAGWWLLTGLLLALVLFWEGRPLSSIGIRQPSISTVGWGIGAFIVGVLAFGFTFPLVDAFGLGTTVEGIEWLVQFPVWLLIVTAVTAGFTEEVMFRGYLLERVGELTGALWIGAVISAVVFTLVHIPLWGGRWSTPDRCLDDRCHGVVRKNAQPVGVYRDARSERPLRVHRGATRVSLISMSHFDLVKRTPPAASARACKENQALIGSNSTLTDCLEFGQ